MRRQTPAILKLLGVLLGPAAVVAAAYVFVATSDDIRLLLIGLHLLTLVWVVAFVRLRPSRPAALPAGFLLSLAGPWLMDSANGGLFPYLGTALVAIFYALPWTAVSLIIAVVLLVRSRRKKY